MLRVGKIVGDSTVDGTGLRVVLFTAGCSHKPKCKHCHGKWLWPSDSGFGMPVEKVYDELLKSGLEKYSLTLTGGEPLDQYEELLDLLRLIREKGLGGEIWLYTGFSWEDVQEKYNTILYYVDVVVEGKYNPLQRDYTPQHYRGSTNQRVYGKEGESWMRKW